MKLLELEAIAILELYGLRPNDGNIKATDYNGYDDQPHLIDINHYLESRELRGEMNEQDKLAKRLLTRPSPLMLSKCLDIYFANHKKGSQEKFIKDTRKHWKSVNDILGNMALDNITRKDAKNFIEKRSLQVATGTVDRELSVIRAVINVVIRENELTIKNPFFEQTIPNLGNDTKVRKPFSMDELKVLIEACLTKPNDVSNILLLCMLTGARLSEICGLRRIDVSLDSEIPYLSLVEYNERTLKTKNSKRLVPLVPIVVCAMQKHLASHADAEVFTRYNDGVNINNTSASASIKNFILKLGVKGKTTHNARHTMRDLMSHADIPPHIQDAIGGWGSNTIGASYGTGYSLKQKFDALTKSLNPVLKYINS